MYIASKYTNESRAHFCQESALGALIGAKNRKINHCVNNVRSMCQAGNPGGSRPKLKYSVRSLAERKTILFL